MEILKKRLGFDIKKADQFLIEQDTIKAKPGPPGKKEIKVSVFKTKDPEICIGRYKYSDGDIWWSLRPKEFKE